jgi:hypothetical protein
MCTTLLGDLSLGRVSDPWAVAEPVDSMSSFDGNIVFRFLQAVSQLPAAVPLPVSLHHFSALDLTA